LTVFNVEAGKRYRFRFINSGFNVCPFLLQFEKHDMQIIATEISYVEPFSIDSLFSATGERFDFVINANKTPGDYWVRVKTMSPCRTIIEGFAVLRYGNKSGGGNEFIEKDPPHNSEDFPEKRLFNSPAPKVKDIPFLRLNAYEYDESIILYNRGNNYRLTCKPNNY
jgi:FtsP/CotA-like multicopper oxidase with cupredoxin domain